MLSQSLLRKRTSKTFKIPPKNLFILEQTFDWPILKTDPFSDWLSHLAFTGTDLADHSKNVKTGVKVTLNEKLILDLIFCYYLYIIGKIIKNRIFLAVETIDFGCF